MPLTQRVGHSYDSPQWSVATMVKKPTLIPNIVVQAVKDNLLADLLLRKGPDAPGGAVQWQEQVAFSSIREDEIIAEFAEIPTTQAEISLPMVRATQKRGIGLQISKEMETRNDVGRVAEEIRLTREQLVRGWNKIFFQAVYQNPNVLTRAATNVTTSGWLDPDPKASKIRRDIAQVQLLMMNQQIQGARDNDRYGFKPDTMVIHPTLGAELLDNEEVNRVFENSPATTISPRYTLTHPKRFGQTLDVIESWEINPNHVLFCTRNKMGFISDEWPLSGSPTQYDESRQTYHTYFTRRALCAIDTPKSVCLLTGVLGSDGTI